MLSIIVDRFTICLSLVEMSVVSTCSRCVRPCVGFACVTLIVIKVRQASRSRMALSASASSSPSRPLLRLRPPAPADRRAHHCKAALEAELDQLDALGDNHIGTYYFRKEVFNCYSKRNQQQRRSRRLKLRCCPQ